MPPPPQKGGGGGGGGGGAPPPADNATDFLWLMAILVVGSVLIWYFGKTYIQAGVFWVRHYEMVVARWMINFYNAVLGGHFGLPVSTGLARLNSWQTFMNETVPGTVQFETIQALSTDVGRYLSYPFAFILMIAASFLYFKHPGSKFRSTYDMKKFREVEHANWPQITPILKLDLINQDFKKGPWALSDSPREFATRHHLLKDTTRYGKPALDIYEEKAAEAFALQLGPLWLGPESLPIHVQALLAVFCARANNDTEPALRLLDQISASAAGDGKLNFTGARQLLSKHVRNKKVSRVMSYHGYVLTMMASMLELARTDGVVSCADFLWLKPVDRRLWYMLNCVGRQTAFSEVAGAYAHWIVERKINWPLRVPMVQEAVTGLSVAIADILYKPENQ